MEHKIITTRSQQSKAIAFGLLLTAIIASLLASPKWGIPVFTWVAPPCLLYYFRHVKIKRKFLWGSLALIFAYVLPAYNVDPFPLPVIVVFGILLSLEKMIVFLLDSWINRKSNRFITTLFFPAACIAMEYLNTSLSGGNWWSVANTQYPFTWLSQLASVTGMWGIGFFIYWFASAIAWSVDRYTRKEDYRTGLTVYSLCLGLILLFGFIRYNFSSPQNGRTVKMAGLSVPLINLWETIYKDYSGKAIKVDPKYSMTSPELKKVNQAEIAFIENPADPKFRLSIAEMSKVNDSLFVLSQGAAKAGAKIICWSEGNAVIFKTGEQRLLERGKAFAAKNKVYLMMTIGLVHPGKIYPGKKFMENEAVLISPGGQVLNTFHKNNPVPMIEATEPGDGNIPVTTTSYGRIATSICYDADFPFQMRQISQKKADAIMLPSGDWYAISPYHTYMAVSRGIENGCSVIREVSEGLSIATDYRGKTYAAMDYFKDGTKLWIADVPLGHVWTIYSAIGDLFAFLCIGFTAVSLVYWALIAKLNKPGIAFAG